MEEGKAHKELFLAIAHYQARHGGIGPARIFATDDFYVKLAKEARIAVRFDMGAMFCGIPVSRFRKDGNREFFLSDEEGY